MQGFWIRDGNQYLEYLKMSSYVLLMDFKKFTVVKRATKEYNAIRFWCVFGWFLLPGF